MITAQEMLTYDEGRVAKSYRDSDGNVTVAVGFNMDTIASHKVWNQAGIVEPFRDVYSGVTSLSDSSIDRLLDTCIANCVPDLKAIFDSFADMPAMVQLALLNLDFNLGRAKFQKFVTFISLIEQGKYFAAGLDLQNTAWAHQLPNRCIRVVGLLNEKDLYHD